MNESELVQPEQNSTVAASAELSAVDRKELAECEATVDEGLKSFIVVGEALSAIRDRRLYREDYERFDDYLENKWGFSRRRAYQLIDASRAADNVKKFSHSVR